MTYSDKQFIILPLLRNGSEHEKQKLFHILRVNPIVYAFVAEYSNFNEWPDDECMVCGNEPNSCNCDGHFNAK